MCGLEDMEVLGDVRDGHLCFVGECLDVAGRLGEQVKQLEAAVAGHCLGDACELRVDMLLERPVAHDDRVAAGTRNEYFSTYLLTFVHSALTLPPISELRRTILVAVSEARNRLESQGYVGLGDRTLADIQSGLRFSPALCAFGVAVATALASGPLVLVMMLTAASGAATPRHPFDYLYNGAVRHVIGKPAIPRNNAPRRFSCAVGAVWLTVTAGMFFAGWTVAGYILGAAMAAMAAFVAMTHICLPSLVYLRLFGRVGDVPEVSAEDAADRAQSGALIIDVRDGELFRAGHAPGAINLVLNDLGNGVEIDRDRTVLVVCQSGVQSLQGAKTLRDAGFPGTCSVRGGMSAWLRSGLPLEQGSAFSG
jgi:rhodanese-related sulfurtransferase